MTVLQVKPQLSVQQKLGTRIKLARIAAGLSQRQLGMAVYLSQSAICEYETGATVPNFLVIQSIAAAVGQELDFFKV